jgi:hypothetical protein
LGEFSPIGRLFTLGSSFKITEVAQIFGQLFLHGSSYGLHNCAKNVFGYSLGDFFIKASGHPDSNEKYLNT